MPCEVGQDMKMQETVIYWTEGYKECRVWEYGGEEEKNMIHLKGK